MKVKYNNKPFSRKDVSGTAFAGDNKIFKQAILTGDAIEVNEIPESLKIIFEEVKSSKNQKSKKESK
jgi:hypothetical protein